MYYCRTFSWGVMLKFVHVQIFVIRSHWFDYMCQACMYWEVDVVILYGVMDEDSLCCDHHDHDLIWYK